MDQKNKKILTSAIIIIILLGGGFYFLIKTGKIPSITETQKENEEYKPLPPPSTQTTERKFEILSVSEGGNYKARDTASKEEIDLFVPSDAKFTTNYKTIKKSSIITAEKWAKFSNGLVITQLSVSAAK